MCGRFVLTTPADALAEEFSAAMGGLVGLVLVPRYNIAPMQDVVVVRCVEGKRSLAMLGWGLIPSWAKDPTIASRLINARSESAATKPSFRDAIRKRRCIVPASGFYEWKKQGNSKQPWYFHPSRPSSLLAMAGLWERWENPASETGETLETCCLLTTSANDVLEPVHQRMPVTLDRDGIERWLDPAITDAKDLADLLVPAPADRLEGYPVSTAVNRVRNDDARNIEEIEDDGSPRQGSLL